MEQLPKFVKIRILKDYLFPDFLDKYSWVFRIPKESHNLKHCFFNWEDEIFQNFMAHILMFLEPRYEQKDEIIIEENGEWLEVIFFKTGTFLVGYELNRKKHFVLDFKSDKKSFHIGAYGCMTNKKAMFIFKTHTNCEGFSIRKDKWSEICKNYDKCSATFRKL